MSRRRYALLFAVLASIAIVAAAAGAGAWLLYTEAGLAWISARARTAAGEGLTLEGVGGTLAGGTRAQRIRYVGEDIEVVVRDAYVRVSPLSLLSLTPRLTELTATELVVRSKPGEPRGRPPDTLELPVNVQLPLVRVERLAVDLGKGPLDLAGVRLAYSGGRTRHTVHELTLDAYEHALALEGAIDARAPFTLQATFSARRAAAPEGTLQAQLTGTLSKLEVVAQATSGEGRIGVQATLEPYAELPLAAIRAEISRLDLHALVAALPQTSIEGTFELERAGVLLAGPIALSNTLHGPYDRGRLPLAALRTRVSTDASTMKLAQLTADLGAAGSLSGGGNLAPERAELEIVTRNLDLSGLHTRMRKTALAGRADVTITRDKQSVAASIADGDLAIDALAHHANARVTIPRFIARARGGEARGEGEIELAGNQRYAASVGFSRFDPAAWGDFPGGSINGTLEASGEIARRSAEARLGIANSRWFDAPLSASGTLSVTGKRVRHADVKIAMGGNRLTARGAFGTHGDTLTLAIDAPRPEVLDARLRGSLKGTAQLSGSWEAPGVRFDLAAADIAFNDLGRIAKARATGFISVDASGPAQIDAVLNGIVTPEARLSRVALEVDGTRTAHSASLQAQGERVDLRVSARGGWRSGIGWSGTLQELVNSGEAAMRLVEPVAITVGPKRAHSERFELRVVGGTLHVDALDYERGRLATSGRFNNLPLRPLLTLAAAPADLAGTLRLSGSWSLESTPLLTGNVLVTRESGDVALGSARPVSLGLQTLTIKARLGTSGADIDAELRSALASASARGHVAPVGSGGAARYAGASPIKFAANLDIARLAPFAEFIDTTMLLEGEAHARVQGSGTLENPQATGPITADRIAVALPADGIELKNGRLRAMLAQREIRVETFSIEGGEGVFTASGTLARSGFDEASVDWRAERFRVFARPDRKLVVSGRGNAALRGGKLAFTGSLHANEGLFELATTELPTLGDDVVVVGREHRTTAATATASSATPRKATRAAVDMSVDLGSNVQIRGRGLDAWLAGKLKIHTDAQGQLRATGTVDALRGTFAAYGQRLDIDRARFYFNGPLSNPGIDILAVRKRLPVEPGVAVTGTLSRPLVQVVSNPPLPQGEALSWLVLGRAPDQAGASQLSALPLATSALVEKAGAPIARALKLDDVGVRTGAAAEQFLTVGKRITERLYLAFEQSLGGTENLLRLEFTLTQRIALRAQTGTASSLGVFYRYVWD